MITYEIPCLLGLEKLVADEVKRLGLQDVRAENGRILCRGSWADCARLNINLRCGARVIALLGQFPAQSFEELFQGVRAIAWEEFLPQNAAFPVKGLMSLISKPDFFKHSITRRASSSFSPNFRMPESLWIVGNSPSLS